MANYRIRDVYHVDALTLMRSIFSLEQATTAITQRETLDSIEPIEAEHVHFWKNRSWQDDLLILPGSIPRDVSALIQGQEFRGQVDVKMLCLFINL